MNPQQQQQAQDGSQFYEQAYMAAKQNGAVAPTLTEVPQQQQQQQRDAEPEDSKDFLNLAVGAGAVSAPSADQQSAPQAQQQQQQQNFLVDAGAYNPNQVIASPEGAQQDFYAQQQSQPGYFSLAGPSMHQGNNPGFPQLSYPQGAVELPTVVSSASYGAANAPVSSSSGNGNLHTMESAQAKPQISSMGSGDQFQQNVGGQQVSSVQQQQQQQQGQLSPPMQQQGQLAPPQTQQSQPDFMHQPPQYIQQQQQLMSMAPQPFLPPNYQQQADFNRQAQQFFPGAPMQQQHYMPQVQPNLAQHAMLMHGHPPQPNFWQQQQDVDSYGFAHPAPVPKRRNRTKTPGFNLRQPYHKKQLSRKTSYNAKWGVKSLAAFLKRSKMEEDPTKLTRAQLTDVLPRYYQSVRKVDGNLYSYNSLVNIRAMLNSYLRAAHPERIDIVVGKEFRRANDVFEGQLRKILHLNKPVTNAAISGKDMEEMIDAGVFSTQRRETLAMKVWFDLTRYLGNQTTMPQSQWTCDMLKVFFDKSCDSFYVTWYTQYADGQEHRMYETKTDGCPVGSLTYYISKLNPTSRNLFQRNGVNEGHIWYGPEVMEQDELDRMMVSISETASLQLKYTNKSVTSSAFTQLYNPRVPSQGGTPFCEEFNFGDVYNCRATNQVQALNNLLGVPRM